MKKALEPTSLQLSMERFFQDLRLTDKIRAFLEVQGIHELVHKYTLPSIKSEIWVYADCANIQTETEDLRFEKCDYNSIADMEQTIKTEILRRLGK